MRRLKKLQNNNATPPTLLDFGSGHGSWSRATGQEGFSDVAYEPSVEL